MRLWICACVVAVGCSKHDAPAPAAGSAEPAKPKHEDRHEPAEKPATLSLAVTVDGQATTWQADAFGKVAHFVGKNNDGEARDVWSLRELAHTLVGPTARVISVTGAEATKTIAPDAWADAARIPILHTTRRGTLKFRWTDKDGAWQETEVKDVSKLEIVAR